MNEIEELEDAADYARQGYLNADLAYKAARSARESARIRMFDTSRVLDSAIDYKKD